MFDFRIYYRKVSSCFQTGKDFLNNIQNTLNIKGKKNHWNWQCLYLKLHEMGERERDHHLESGGQESNHRARKDIYYKFSQQKAIYNIF